MSAMSTSEESYSHEGSVSVEDACGVTHQDSG